MIVNKMLIAGGLVLALGAYTPAMAQSNGGFHGQGFSNGNVNASRFESNNNQNGFSSGSNREFSRPLGMQQNEMSQNDSQGNWPSGNQNQWNQGFENQRSGNQGSGNQFARNQPGMNPSSLLQMQGHVQRQIHHLDRDLADAEQYEIMGREALDNGDVRGAEQNFKIAQHILRMATGGANFGPAMLTENPRRQEMMVERAIQRAHANGMDVSDAEKCLNQGRQALQSEHFGLASQDFRAAELSLGIPVEVGYAEVWEEQIPTNRDQGQGSHSAERGNQPENQQGMAFNSNGFMRNSNESRENPNVSMHNSNESMPNSSNMQAAMSRADVFIQNGERALSNGNQQRAQLDFEAARHVLNRSYQPFNSFNLDKGQIIG